MRRSKEKGKSHSIRPITVEAPLWCKYRPEEVEGMIIDLAKKGVQPSLIGVILRDQYGIPLVKHLIGKKIYEVFKEHGLTFPIPEDLTNLIRHAEEIRRHLEEHPKDKHSRRGLQTVESKIRRLSKYYIREGVLPSNWKYEPGKISIFTR